MAYGLLSLDVIRSSRSLLFFFWTFRDPSPSTSASGRGRFNRLEGTAFRAFAVEERNESSHRGMDAAGKVNSPWWVLDSAVGHPVRISTGFEEPHDRSVACN